MWGAGLSPASDASRSLLRQIDQTDIGVLANPIEHDARAIRRDVEGVHRRRTRQLRQLPALVRVKVQLPEVVVAGCTIHSEAEFQEHQALAARQKAQATASTRRDADIRKIHGPAVGMYREQWSAGGLTADVRDHVSVR